MGLMSHISYAYDDFSSYRVSYFLISSLANISLMTSMTMMVLGLGLPENLVYLVRAFFYFLKFLLIVFMDFQLMESKNPVVVSVKYYQSEYFPTQKLFLFQIQIS